MQKLSEATVLGLIDAVILAKLHSTPDRAALDKLHNELINYGLALDYPLLLKAEPRDRKVL